METGRLEGRVAVVTGGGAGFGRVVARHLGEAGAHVLVADVDEAAAQATATAVVAAGGSAEGLGVDVRDEQQAAALVERATERGGPHLLVNNAGGWTPGDQYPDAEPAAWSATLALNLTAPMHLTALVLAAEAAGPGRVVVNVASSAATGTGAYGSPEYAAAKAGLLRFTTSLADAEERHGSRVIAVVPGWIGLPRAHEERAAMSEADRAAAPSFVEPDDLAALVVRVLTDPGVLSGTVVHVPDGEAREAVPPSG